MRKHNGKTHLNSEHILYLIFHMCQYSSVFFGNSFVIEIFGNSRQGKAGISGNVFDGSFHVSSLLIYAVLDNIQEFCYNYTKKYSWWTGE